MSNDSRLVRMREFIDSRMNHLSSSGSDENYTCPFCDRDGQDHKLHINYHKGDWGVAICHGCWYKTGDLRNLLRDVFGYMPKRLRRLLARPQLSIEVEKLFAAAKEEHKPVPLPKGFRRLPSKSTDIMSRIMLNYLKERGFTHEDIDKFGVGYIPDPDDYPRAYGYIIFPFHMDGRVLYWQGRRVASNAGNKSYNPDGTGKKWLLYGYAEAVDQKRVFCGEGPLDAIAWGRGGIALTGKVLFDQQVRAISMLPACEEFIFCLDPEEIERTKKLARDLQSRVSFKVGYLPLRMDRGDPADNKHRLHRLADRDTVWIGHDGVVREAINDMKEYAHRRVKPTTRFFEWRINKSIEEFDKSKAL